MEQLTALKSSFKIPFLGGNIEFFLYGIDEVLLPVYEGEAYKEGLRLQKIFNFFDRKSELSELNLHRQITASDELAEVIKKSIEFSKATGGLYDAAKGKQFLQRKSSKKITALSGSYKDIAIKGNWISLQHDDAMIDLGSIAKGYIADMLLRKLKSIGVPMALVNARGDIANYGNYRQKIEIQHPRNPKTKIFPFFLHNQGAATSGDYNQYYGSYNESHIVCSTDLISVTAVAESLMEADAAATSAFVLGSKNIADFALKYPSIKIAAVDNKLDAHFFNNFEELAKEQ